jgi:RHH-type transcriptional regulator, proline utilization regulon repressor / proline dehydrogenase / delta 1-pyrroline-5-carboxylate dehydrogenase
MTADTLEEAIAIQNQIEYGLTAGLHSLNSEELGIWLDSIQAGNLYVNRGITGAIVQRQPFGGWKRSAVGAGAKAGGPNYLFGLGEWMPQHGASSTTLHLRGLEKRVTELIEASQPALDYESFDLLRRSALSDEVVWAEEYGVAKDVSGVGVERNLFRYRPLPVTIRIGETSTLAEGLRIIAAGILAKSPFTVSTAIELPKGVRTVLAARDVRVVREGDAAWLDRAAKGGITTPRVRLLGDGASELAAALGGTPDVAVWSHPVTPSGRVELLPFLHEQAISITNHRFGNPTTLSDSVI